MLETVIYIAAMYAITFALKEIDGPFFLISTVRLALLRNKYVGFFFYKLFECYFCLGFYSGLIVYLAKQHFHHINPFDFILWGLAGSAISYLTNIFVERDYDV